MGSLALLNNPATQIQTLNGEGNVSVRFRPDPLTNAPTWDATTQYFKGDWVVDPADGQMYCWVGPVVPSGDPQVVSVLGGTSPYNGGAGWVKAGPNGVNYYDTKAPTATIAVPGAWTALTNNAFTVPANSDWLVTFQGRLAAAAPVGAAGEVSTVTITPAGLAPGTAVNATWFIPGGATGADFTCSFLVSVPAAAPSPAPQTGTITLTGTSAAALTLSATALTIVRLG